MDPRDDEDHTRSASVNYYFDPENMTDNAGGHCYQIDEEPPITDCSSNSTKFHRHSGGGDLMNNTTTTTTNTNKRPASSSSRDMLDNLAEELNQLCQRMKRTSSVQSGISHRPEEASWLSCDADHPNNRTPTHQSLNSGGSSRPHSRGFCPAQELASSASSRRERLNLNLFSGGGGGGDCCAAADNDDDQFQVDPFDQQQQLQYFIKTPVSPSIAVEAMRTAEVEKNFSDHQLYFEPPPKSTYPPIDDKQEVFPCLRRLSTHVKPEEISFISSRKADDSSGFSSSSTSDNLHPSHRAVHRFVPRHKEELMLEIGDPIHVEYEADDGWCHGINLRTGLTGIFPMAYVFEVDLEDDCGGPLNPLGVEFHLGRNERATFLLTFMGSVEVAHHKGNDVLVQAISKVLQFYQNKEDIVVPQTVLLDISFRGIHMIDKSKKTWFRCPNFDYFYSLQNISFCGAHPKQLRYFGFITKHPLLPRFACHVFMSKCSTEPVVDAIGRAFQKSYNEYMAFSHPTEDIYIE